MNGIKNIPHTFADSGISVKDSITLTVNKKVPPFRTLIMIGIALLGVAGGIMSFLSFYDFDYDKNILLLYNALFFLVFSVILNLPKKWKLLIIPVCVLFETLFVRMREEFISGYKAMYNVIAQRLQITGEGIAYYRISENIDITEVTTIFLIFTTFIFSLFVCYATYCNKNAVLGIALTFITLESGFYFGLAPSYIACIMVVAYWVAVTSMSLSGSHGSDYLKGAGFIRKENDFFAKSHIKFRVREYTGFITVIITFTVFIIIIAVTGVSQYKRPDRLNEIRYNVHQSVSEFSADNIPASMNRIASSFGKVTASPGQLGQYSNLSYNNETDLIAKFDGKLTSEIYIKCFSGSYYTGDSWNDFPKSVYNDNNIIFEKFEERNIYPQDFLNISLENFKGVSDYCLNIHTVMKNSKQIYVPYGADNKNLEKKKDTEIECDNTEDYSFDFKYIGSYEDFLSYVQLAETGIQNSKFREMSELEQEYRNFVYNEYLQLPDNDDIQQIRDTFSELIDSAEGVKSEYSRDDNTISTEILYDNTSIYEILCRIRNIIAFDTEYTLSPGKTPATRDFVNYFLLENKKGYCSHYASAGVILARMCGIPARYAEGYIITDSDFENTVPDSEGNYVINVKDSRAHAWAEIYIDGLGWIPFEFTPGYDEGIISAETSSSDQSVNIVINETVVTETVTETETQTSEASVTYNETNPVEATNIPETAETEIPASVSDESSGNVGGILSFLKNNEMLRGALLIVIAVIMLIAIVSAVIALRRLANIRKREKSFSGSIQNENAVNAYIYMLKLLEFAGISNKSNMTYIDFAEYAEKNTSFFSRGEFINATHTALKSDMSNHKISEREAETVINLSEKLAEKIINQSDSREKFIFRYIYNLS
jgi:hypothetical protein